MGRHLRRRLIATAVLACALVGASQLFAAVIVSHNTGPQMRTTAAGALSLSNSKEGAAIFTASNLAPGHSTEGTVTIANTGSAAGSLALSATELSDSPGTYGGNLSEVLDLQIAETGSGTEVYSGTLDSMPEQQLGPLAAGESRTYRFSVRMADGGAAPSDYTGDNLYQRATTSLSYDWTLTEIPDEGGPEPLASPEPPPAAPATPAPAAPAQERPAGQAHPGAPLTGTPRDDLLSGTPRHDLIYGLAGGDRIFGRGGGDYLLGGSGADFVDGGAGGDRLRGGIGSDRIAGGPGPDIIFARDGRPDSIDCGSGRDLIYVDQHDVTTGCEAIHRLYGRLFGN
jgi:Ca2+-binding RTX toxin-like protein